MLVNAGAVDGSVHLKVVYADDLIYPADERWDFDVDAGYVNSSATESPGNQAGQLVEAVILAYQWSSTITLGIIIKKINKYCVLIFKKLILSLENFR